MAKAKEVMIPASTPKRFMAFVIDLLVVYFFVAFPMFPVLEKSAPKNPLLVFESPNPVFAKVAFLISILVILYFAILEYKISTTIGKMALNIHVENENQEKKFWQYLVRSMYLLPVIPFSLLWIADPIYVFFNPDKKRLCEIISKTKCVHKAVIV